MPPQRGQPELLQFLPKNEILNFKKNFAILIMLIGYNPVTPNASGGDFLNKART